MRTLLAFGDSNTHGTVPLPARGAMERYGPEIRWPTVMAQGLADDWHLVEEGLPGRTTQFGDPVMGSHMDGQEGLKIALASHRPVSLLLIMLGTNDLKRRFDPSASRITAGVSGLLDLALHADMAAQHPGMEVLVICPPAVKELGPIRGDFNGAGLHGPKLAAAYADLAQARGVHFFDAGMVIETSDVDGVHFEPDAHKTLGAALAGVVAKL
ncbi:MULTISPECIES: GDSL-type esterase/lipase family protein [unclassified Marinovum]